MILHTISGAPCGWRALLGFAFKQIDVEVRYLDGSRREHETPTFLELNPRAKVPVLEADGLVLRDSIAILAWLESAYPARPLFGRTTEETAAIWQMLLECAEYLQPATNGVVFPVFAGDGEASAANTQAAENLRAAAKVLDGECEFLERTLGERRFLCGPDPSAADAVAFAEIGRVQRAIETKPHVMASLGYLRLEQRFPHLSAWYGRVSDLPGVAATAPIHWRAALRPRERLRFS
ncbi:glutathione S-transferase family protein [Denitrobaculum tricleocarpae]|uniref:Glutathione S-transferase family protein n=2 Tax=Denitrobaculum tricleocarpae TaxID=2591009 RepID=A0A545TFC9_9PROT|nr:glutathione S-transferase family protein [Denitrobaculum tricleocarpae]